MNVTAFSHSVRVLACGNCGAPLDVPSSGGAVRCAYCQAALRVQPRQEDAELAIAMQASSTDEADRFEKLRAQAAHPWLLPQSLAELAIGGVLLPQHVERATAEWRQARSELAANGQFPVAERLFHLTRLLSDCFGSDGDDMRRRALLETAMELLQAPRHRQVLRGALACNAARVGDLAAADAWLAGCNPRSDDIHVDTAYRFSKAYVCTVRQDWSDVLQVLGSRMGDIPLAGDKLEACGLLRANALERSGQLPTAVEQLQALMGTGSRGIAALDQFSLRNRQLALCPQSLPVARQRESASIAEQGRARVVRSIGFGGQIVGMSIFGMIGLVALGAGLFEKSEIQWGPASLGLFFLMFALLIGYFGILVNLRRRRHETRVFQSGLDATLTVIEARSDGEKTSSQLKAVVQIADRPPYEGSCVVSGEKEMQKAAPGSWLRARVDPQDPSIILPFV